MVLANRKAVKNEQVQLAPQDEALIAVIQSGLPICSHPYAEVGRQIGMSEQQVIERLGQMQQQGLIKRMGVIVRHRRLGYHANAMVVWNIADNKVRELGRCIGRFEFITLCYQRPRHLPDWPYNLFCMIHGKDRDEVHKNINLLIKRCDLHDVEHEVLFSRRCFKQRGAQYKQPVQQGMSAFSKVRVVR